MISTLRWRLRQALRSLWVPIVGFGLLGLASAGIAALLSPVLPEEIGLRIGAEAIDQILNILATSMLTVTTFSVSIMVTAFGSAASTATPRALVLLQADSPTRLVLSIFVGAFIYSLVGIIALKTGVYGAGGRVVLFVVTCIVLAVIVVALVRWIGHLTEFGRLGDTLDRVEAAASHALKTRLAAPYLGGQRSDGTPSTGVLPLPADRTGHVQHIDVARLSACAEAHDLHCHLEVLPGDFVSPAQALMQVSGLPADGEATDKIERMLRAAVTIGQARDFDQDPRFGIVTLTEIASRALSPAVNDPGTAIDVLGRLVRVLSAWHTARPEEVRYPRVHVPALVPADFLRDGFRPIARDGAALIEVQVRLQHALAALARMAPQVFAPAAVAEADRAAAHAEAAMALEADREAIRALALDLARQMEDPGGSTVLRRRT